MLLRFIVVTVLLCLNSFMAHAKNPVVLISIDGFSNQFMSKYRPVNMTQLANNGVRAEALLPVFPSKTFPNHLSIVTGMYPQHHGIVHNAFFHPGLNQYYHKGAETFEPKWLTALPIWTLAEQQGIKSAIYFWPGSEAKLAGQLPSFYFPYQQNTPNKSRVDQIIAWLQLPKSQAPQFIASYFSTVDEAGHEFGLDSVQLAKAVFDIDQLIGELMTAIHTRVKQPVDLIIVSDHGMIALNQDGVINWATMIPWHASLSVVNGQTQLYITGADSQVLTNVQSQLSAQAHGRYQVYSKGHYPAHWQLGGDAVVIPDMIVNAIPPHIFVNQGKTIKAATHGYDARNQAQLSGVFIASGPSFKQKLVINAIENIHVFPLLSNLLGLQAPEQIDGDPNVLAPVLQGHSDLSNQ